jgi:hypothetical protein
MRIRHRLSVLVATATLGLAAVVGLTACTADLGQTAVDVAADLTPEGQALAALGFNPTAADPTPTASPDAKGGRVGERAHKRRLARVLLRKNMLHGEVVVQTKNGPKTIDVQRGEVTAISDTTVTVKSSDGFTLTWTFGDPITVLERRHTVQPDQVTVGTRIGVAGTKDGDATRARLIVIARQR